MEDEDRLIPKSAASKFVRSIQHMKRRWLYETVRETDLIEIIGQMSVCSPADMVRVGGQADGGYVIPNDLNGVACCFSPGVGPVAEFELDLQHRYGIPSYLADYSVDVAPPGIDPEMFAKAYIGNKSDDPNYIRLSDWIGTKSLPEDVDLMLQMDIEGGEYEVLATADISLLKRFRIMIVEFHNLHQLKDRRTFKKFSSVMNHITPHFRVVHIHPNNNGPVDMVGSIECPCLLEFTFARRDRHYAMNVEPSCPHELDRKNVDLLPDVVLHGAWHGAGQRYLRTM